LWMSWSLLRAFPVCLSFPEEVFSMR